MKRSQAAVKEMEVVSQHCVQRNTASESVNNNNNNQKGGSYFEGIGGVFELDFELHHGGGRAGADDGGQGANGGDGLRQIGVLAPGVELVDDGEGFVGGVIMRRRRRRAMDGGGLSLSEPLGADYAELHRSVLVVRRCLPILHSISLLSPLTNFLYFTPFFYFCTLQIIF